MDNRPGKRVVYLVQGLGTGGLEQVVVLLAGQMVRRGHEVVVCCYDKTGALAGRSGPLGVEVALVRRRRGVDPGYILRLARWLKSRRPDVLHMHNETALFYGTLAGLLARVPVLIYTEHDGVFPRSLAARWMNRRLVKRLTHATAVSDAVRRLWCHQDGIDPATVQVVPNGVPDVGVQTPRAECLQPGRLRVGTVGRLSCEKGMDVLVEAFALVCRQRPDADLVLVGDGSERAALERLASERGLADAVSFLGLRDDVPALLGGFDVFVLPSRSEGLPMAVLEAMAAGLPIVATAVGGVPEVIRHGETGLLVRPEAPDDLAEAIVQLADDEDLRRRLARAARTEFDERYEISHMVDAYEALMMTT